MQELAVYNGLDCIGYIRETEGGCEAFAASAGRDVRLGRFANRQDAKAAISQAGRHAVPSENRTGAERPSEKGSDEEQFSPEDTDTGAEPVSAGARKPVPARNRLSANATRVSHAKPGKRAGR